VALRNQTHPQLFLWHCFSDKYGGSLHPSSRTLSMTIILAFLSVPLITTVFTSFFFKQLHWWYVEIYRRFISISKMMQHVHLLLS
jgi:hypothetical protein